jgi:hypothetical protein
LRFLLDILLFSSWTKDNYGCWQHQNASLNYLHESRTI